MPTVRPRRLWMRSSTWRALGNTYRVVEPGAEPLDAARASALAEGTDGVLEILARTSTTVRIAIWNADGSRAELSGNGTRIAAAWLAAQSGAREVDVGVGALTVRTRIHEDGEIEQELGEVDRRRAGDRGRNRVRARSRSATRTRSCSATRPRSARSALDSRRTCAFRTARTSKSPASTLPARSRRASGSEEWGRRCRRARAPLRSPRPRMPTAR